MRGTTNIPTVCVIVRKDSKILFVLREHTGWMDGKYSLPAGHVEHGESFKVSAAREALEETGLTVAPEHLTHVFTMQTNQGPDNIRVQAFFEAEQWTGEPKNMEPAVHSKIAWFEAANLPYDQIMDFQAAALKAMRTGATYGETGWDVPPTV